jgi:hypothetical protein
VKNERQDKENQKGKRVDIKRRGKKMLYRVTGTS